ncbi:hypothetical protein ACP70R_007669 [Stipagrostis hirtigluma subsp. patula]
MPTSSLPATVGSGAPEPSTSVLAAEEVVGSHVLTIEGYTSSKELVCGEFYSSCTFAAGGHGWSIRYYPGGADSRDSDWISIYLHLDRTHAPNVKARFTFSLVCLNGKPAPWHSFRSAIYTFSGKAASQGYPRFIAREALEKSTYLWNDSFRVRCDVTVLKEIQRKDATTTRFVIVPPPAMDRDLGHLLTSGEGADVMFEVDGETISAHRSILAARSPVFKAQLLGPMKENTAVCMWIDDMEGRVFKAMLDFVYTDSFPKIDQGETVVMAQHLLVAADRFGLERLKLMCEDKLCNYVDTSNVETILALSEQHGCHGLKEACFEFLMSGSNLKEAMATDGFDHLTKSCPSVLKELLAKVVL